jgi:hypothetical protein
MEWVIEAEEERAKTAIMRNMRILAGKRSRFKLVDHALDVYGEAYGVATDSSVGAALHALKTKGDLVVYQNASRLRERVVGRGPNLRLTPR